MDKGIVDTWRTDGFVILPGYLSAEDLAPALDELETMFPTPDGFHDGTDPRRTRYVSDQFGGIDGFPFARTELSLLAVNPRLIKLAEDLLGEQELRIYSAEAWAKYTSATDYDQDLHRDYLNQTVLVPSRRTSTSNWRCSCSSPTLLKISARHTSSREPTQLTYR